MLIHKILSLGPLGWHIGIKQTICGVRKSLDKKDERKELKLMASDFFILYQVAINRLLCPLTLSPASGWRGDNNENNHLTAHWY